MNPFYKSSKTGNVPITILVIGIFAVCTLAIASFVISNINLGNDFIGVGMIQTMNSFEEEIEFYSNPEINQDPLKLMPLFENGVFGDAFFHGKKIGNQYSLNATYSETDFEAGRFNFQNFGFETKRIIYIEYTFP